MRWSVPQRREPKFWLELAVALAAVSGLAISIVSCNKAVSAEDESYRLATVDKISWFPYKIKKGKPELRVENHSLFSGYKTILHGKGTHYVIHTLMPCSRVRVQLPDTTHDLYVHPENYTLTLRVSGDWWETDRDRVAKRHPNPNAADEAFHNPPGTNILNTQQGGKMEVFYDDLTGCG
ncbi:hypothetical protein [Streptomyces sp. GESEQ-4]|uniref:hypothetical protein n=1 Tax=Streptomyces sp. GESEQ-4 TaxID=2812655 RepID=UPI001B33B1E6|nr:hypothetical protein [Streptomyces sp. GESEQ-4]